MRDDRALRQDDPDEYRIEVHDDLASIDAAAWDALVAAQPSASPFMRHAYLHAMEASGSATADTGWSAQHLTLHRGAHLVAACPLYLKFHSYGEYVFDWAWADAYERNGQRYYPKLLTAVPFTPVPGPRLLALEPRHRLALLQALEQVVTDNRLSSAHLLFVDEADLAAVREAGWMVRDGVQFHWHNRHAVPDAAPGALPYADFADFLASLQREKRKKIQQERRRVRDAGVGFEVLRGDEITPADWDFFHACYRQTYAAHHSTPYLTRDFFARMAATMPQHWLLFVAEREGERLASSLLCIDGERGLAWGRYWGAVEHVDCLHFEACYYQPLQWCIEQGFRRFEGGAQGEHKMSRGLMPAPTASAHWLAQPRFADAVARFLERESLGVEAYVGELRERNPFKSTAG